MPNHIFISSYFRLSYVCSIGNVEHGILWRHWLICWLGWSCWRKKAQYFIVQIQNEMQLQQVAPIDWKFLNQIEIQCITFRDRIAFNSSYRNSSWWICSNFELKVTCSFPFINPFLYKLYPIIDIPSVNALNSTNFTHLHQMHRQNAIW